MRGLWVACLPWLIGCGFHSGVAADAGEDGTDTPMLDASLCFDGFTRVCLPALPTMPLVVGSDTTIDTAAGCEATTMGTADGVCVVAATMIEVRSGATLRATGLRPLVLLATSSIVVAGTLDAASHRGGTTGPGANPAACRIGTAPTLANGSGGGGHGGTFATIGGDGGDSVGRGAKGVASTTVDVPVSLRGGCPGVAGAGPNPGAPGAGGGAVELNAGSIMVSGSIHASGAGGQAGTLNDSGGGGGGSGGMIVFDTATLAVTGTVMVQGGGGGGGSGGGGAGTPGADPTQAGVGAAPGDGYHDGGGTGGKGGTGAIAGDAGDAEAGALIGGGGGGGGAGVKRSGAPG
jgi:hypothetical protein